MTFANTVADLELRDICIQHTGSCYYWPT